MTRMVVVFPAPLGPRSPSTSPASTSKLTSLIASVRPNLRLTPRTWTPAVIARRPSGAGVGGAHACPLRIRVARGDRRQRLEGLVGVGPLHNREAVVGGARKVLLFVVEGPGEAVHRVGVEPVEPGHEALPRQVGAHGVGGLLELVAHRPALGSPLVQIPAGLVLGEVVAEAGDDGVARVAVGIGVAGAVHEVAARRAEVGTDLL